MIPFICEKLVKAGVSVDIETGLGSTFFLDQDCIITTIGQLNFFKWFISKNAYQYVEKNLSKIESEMNKSKKKCTSKPTSQVKPKKYRDNISQKSYNVNMISCSAPKKVTKIEVTFD